MSAQVGGIATIPEQLQGYSPLQMPDPTQSGVSLEQSAFYTGDRWAIVFILEGKNQGNPLI